MALDNYCDKLEATNAQLTAERDELLGICRIMAGGGSLDDFNQAIQQAKVMVAKHKGGE